jgi:hypothetical protein
VLSNIDKKIDKMPNQRKVNEIEKIEGRVQTMEKLNNVVINSLRSSSKQPVPTVEQIASRYDYYFQAILPAKTPLSDINKQRYTPVVLQKMYVDQKEKEQKELIEQSMKREDEIDTMYMTSINAKLKMLEKI